MKTTIRKKIKPVALVLIGLILVLIIRNCDDLQILYKQQKFSRLMTTEYVSDTYHMQITERYLIPNQARGTFYGIEEQTNKEKYILFYFQRHSGKSAIYEIYADDGINRAEAVEILESNQKDYDILTLDIFGFYLGTLDHDIRKFLYWRALPIDFPQNSVFIQFRTGELLHNEEAIYN